jgi:hypothetical protein
MPSVQEATNTWDETAAGTASGATATHAAVTNRIHVVRHISGHTDADSLIQILGGAAGATVIYETKIDVSLNGFGFSINIPDGIHGDPGIAVAGKVASSSADCQINISGYSA